MFEVKNEQRNLPELFELGSPILGICYGAQLTSYLLGGKVATAPVSEYGKTEVEICQRFVLFETVSKKTICWMSHTDYIEKEPESVTVTAHTPVCPVAAMECPERKLYAVQFHPEVEGMKMLSNFVYIKSAAVLGCGKWRPLWKPRLLLFGRRSETAECSAPCSAVWTLL